MDCLLDPLVETSLAVEFRGTGDRNRATETADEFLTRFGQNRLTKFYKDMVYISDDYPHPIGGLFIPEWYQCRDALKRILGIESSHVVAEFYDTLPEKGSCPDFDDYPEPHIRINLRIDITRTMLTTLCHEFVHALQYIEGRLSLSKSEEGIFVWEGQEHVVESLKWKDRPWEIEAILRETSLMEQLYGECDFLQGGPS